MQALLISFMATNIVHGYLVLHERGNGRSTLSERAVQHRLTYMAYVFAHMIGGLAFGVFAYNIFWLQNSNLVLTSLAFAGVLTQWAQAVVPDKGKYGVIHTALAFAMSGFIILLSIGAIFGLPLPTATRFLLLGIELIILAGYPMVTMLPYKYFWILQIININLFYLQMFIVLLTF